MKKYVPKLIWLVLIVLWLITLASDTAQAAEEWRPFPKNYDGVSIAIRTHYFPFDCEANWRFTNNNPYPVEIEVFNKVYITNYGKKLVSNGYQTYVKLKPGETKSMLGLGDQLSYDDEAFGAILDSRSKGKNGSKMTTFVVDGVKKFDYKVTRLDEDNKGSADSGGKSQTGAPAKVGNSTAEKQQPSGVTTWVCKHCGEQRQGEAKPSSEGCSVGSGGAEVYHDSNMLLDDNPPAGSGGGSYSHEWIKQNDSQGRNAKQAPKQPSTEETEWLSLLNSANEGASISVKFIYAQNEVKVIWHFTNHNRHSTRMEITAQSYVSNYGNFSLSPFGMDLKPGEQRMMTQTQIYNHKAFGNALKTRVTDKNGRETTPFLINSINNWTYRLTKLAETGGQPKTRGGLKLPAGVKTAR